MTTKSITRYVRYSASGATSYGILEGDTIRQLQGDLFSNPRPTGRTVRLSDARLLVPLDPSSVGKVIGVPGNYNRPDEPPRTVIHPRWFASLQEKMQLWDGAILRFYRQSPASIIRSFLFHFLGWLAGAAEVFLIFKLLHLPISIPAAFCLEALWVLLRSGAFMIPASLGASEGFMILVCTGLGISSVIGLTVGLIRRVREMVWMGLGLLEFSRDG